MIKRIPEKSGGEIGKPDSGVKDFKYEKIDPEKENEFLKELDIQKEFSLAVEDFESQIYMSFSWKTGRAHFLKAGRKFLEGLKKILEKKDTLKIGFDLKNIYKLFRKEKIGIGENFFDCLIAAYLLNPGINIYFEKMVLEELDDEISFPEKKKGQTELIGETAENEQYIFQKLAILSDYSFRLKNILEKKIKDISREQEKRNAIKKTLKNLFSEVEMPLVEVIFEMEREGVKINSLILEGISKTIEKKLSVLEEKIYELSGKKFNINSPGQLADILFNVLKIPTEDIKKTKTQFSTASSELQKIKSKNPIVEKIEDYRELFKLKTTYLDTLPTLVDEHSRLHTNFNQAVTATGRLSSSDPNLQNIPIKSDLGQLMRTAFVADEGSLLISGDYSQIDLRVVAHVSEDKKLIEAFHRGDDIHRMTAAEINDVPLSKVTEKMRSAAKALNFGVIYGMSVFGFSQAAGIDRDKAKEHIDKYFKDFPGVAKYIRETKEFAKKNKYVETILGRRRNIAEINSPNFQVQSAAERMAINMPIQGLAADIVKIAMINIYRKFKDDPDVKMVLQIHDEIILEAKKEKAKDVSEKVKEIMEAAYKIKVPLVADVKIGENWGEI